MKYVTEKNNAKLTVTFKVNATEWEGAMQKAYEQNKSKYSVPGFRKGHTPRRVLENMYGKGLFFEDALYICAQEYYSEFLDKNKDVQPVARPVIDEKSVKANDKGVTFAVDVVVKPDVELGQYTGLTIKKSKPATVKAAEVDAEVERIRERNARFVEITDRAVQQGDEVNLDYSGSVDGVKFEGGTAEKQTLVIGSHTFIEGFEDQLVGMNIGETKDINVTFPAEYHAEDLKGKAAVFTVKINAIRVKELPELDDEFAKDVSEFSTLKEYKDDIKKNMKNERAKEAEIKDENTLMETIISSAKIDIPKEMIDEQIDDFVEDFKYQLMYQGLNIDNYFKYTNNTMESLRANYTERAEKAVRTRLVLEEIAKKENLKADPAVVDAKIKEYAVQAGIEVDKFTAQLTPDQRVYFENQAITESLIEFLKKSNTIA